MTIVQTGMKPQLGFCTKTYPALSFPGAVLRLPGSVYVLKIVGTSRLIDLCSKKMQVFATKIICRHLSDGSTGQLLSSASKQRPFR